jgi:hypothetical protein
LSLEPETTYLLSLVTVTLNTEEICPCNTQLELDWSCVLKPFCFVLSQAMPFQVQDQLFHYRP